MRRNWPLWFAFSLCLGVVLAAMAWISVTAMRLDEAETRARRQAALEENVRLALWRIDSALSPILAQEKRDALHRLQVVRPAALCGLAITQPRREVRGLHLLPPLDGRLCAHPFPVRAGRPPDLAQSPFSLWETGRG